MKNEKNNLDIKVDKNINKNTIKDNKNNDNDKEVIYCKYCNKFETVIKKGTIKKSNKKVYYCKNCKKYFTLGKDNRIKRNNRERELALLLYSHNSSLRSIQSIIEKFYNTKISFRLIEKWVKSFKKMLNIDIYNNKEEEEDEKNNSKKNNKVDNKETNNNTIEKNKPPKPKPKTIDILELDELYSYFYDLKKTKRKS